MKEDQSGDKRLVAYVVGEAAGGGTLRDYLKGARAGVHGAAALFRLDLLPLTPNGKIDRRRLPATEGSKWSLGWSDGDAPRTRSGRDLTAIWAEVLGPSRSA